MASIKTTPEPGDGPVCTVCLQTTDVLKVVTTCKHQCCVECLSKHLKKLSSASESFPCPICQEQCPLSENGVDDLEDFGQAVECREATEYLPCLSCSFTKNATVEAVNMCPECGNMCLCQECTENHGSNKATASHAVVSLKSSKKKTSGNCRVHKEAIGSYCCTCQRPCCRLCVLLDHGSHDVKKICEEFRSVLEEVQRVSEEYEKRSNHMKRFEKQMQFLKNSEVCRRRDVLIREIEDQSEICIQRIIKQKDEFKEKVQQDYQVVSEVYDWLAKFPALDKLDNAIAQSKTLISKAEPHPHDIEKLSAMKRQIVDSDLYENKSVDKFMEAFTKLFRNPTRFVPNQSAQSIGELVPETPRSIKSIEKCKLVFEKELPSDDKGKYIPCVTILGNDFYAIAHPATDGKRSNGIDIYKLPGDFQRTITDHVNPVYDIAATPDGQLAVLSDGQTQDSCSVRLFDPETGEMKSTRDVSVSGPISFDVNLRHQYAILSQDGTQRVTIANEDGSIEHTKVVDLSLVPDASRITCCAGDIIVLLGKTVVCDVMGGTILCSYSSRVSCKDISATWFGEVNLTYESGGVYKIQRWNSLLNHQFQDRLTSSVRFSVNNGSKAEARLSVRGGYIVSSQEHTIRVFKEE